MSKRDRHPQHRPDLLATPRALTITNSDPDAQEVTFTGRDMLTGEPRSETLRVSPPAGAWWNNIRRAWFTGPVDAPVMVDPQPPAPTFHISHSAQHGPGSAWDVPPAVKVSA